MDHREDLVGERTRIQNRLRWHLHELNPGVATVGNLSRKKGLDTMDAELAGHQGLVADLARDQAANIRSLTNRIDALECEIVARTSQAAPALLALPGSGFLTAAKLVGEVGGASRFKSRAAFAMHNGIAPIPVWSGRADRFRLNRGATGNSTVRCIASR